MESGLEHKFCRFDADQMVVEGLRIEGYASLFGQADQGGDVVAAGAMVRHWRRWHGPGAG